MFLSPYLKKKLKKNPINQKITKLAHRKSWAAFCVDQLLHDMGLALECLWYTQSYSIGENTFSPSQKMSISSTFVFRGGSLCPFPLLHARILPDGKVSSCRHSLCEFVRGFCPVVSGKDGFLRFNHHLCLLQYFNLLLWLKPQTPEEAFDKDIHCGWRCSNASQCVHILQLQDPVLITIYWKKKIFWRV